MSLLRSLTELPHTNNVQLCCHVWAKLHPKVLPNIQQFFSRTRGCADFSTSLRLAYFLERVVFFLGYI